MYWSCSYRSPAGMLCGRADGRVWAAEGMACCGPPATFGGSLPADGFAFAIESISAASATSRAIAVKPVRVVSLNLVQSH